MWLTQTYLPERWLWSENFKSWNIDTFSVCFACSGFITSPFKFMTIEAFDTWKKIKLKTYRLLYLLLHPSEHTAIGYLIQQVLCLLIFTFFSHPLFWILPSISRFIKNYHMPDVFLVFYRLFGTNYLPL